MPRSHSMTLRVLSFLLTCVLLCLSACDSTKNPSQDEQADEPQIRYRLATKEEGQKLKLSNTAYFEGLSQNDLEFRTMQKDAAMEDYLSLAASQIVDFTPRDTLLLEKTLSSMEQTLTENGFTLPPLDEIVFIKSKMADEGYATGYTHGTQIYLSDSYLMSLHGMKQTNIQSMAQLLWHELFHCLTRCNPDFREEMYSIIHFTVQKEDFPIPPSVASLYLSNPDVEHHNAYATFEIGGEKIDCFPVLVTSRAFATSRDLFSTLMTPVLVPIDGRDVSYPLDSATNKTDVFGGNTSYTIDPEECLADNFSYAMLFQMKGKGSKPYANPEIIEAILAAVSKGKN